MAFRKVLCPIDFSPGARQAMRAAIALANEAGAELVLAHAWHAPALAFAGEHQLAAELLEELHRDARAELHAATREAEALGARRLEARLVAGVPPYELIRELERDPAFDLVVIGTHGRTGLPRALLGSVAEGVVRRAPCSVLVVPASGAPRPFARVLCPVDFSSASERAAEAAAAFARPAPGAPDAAPAGLTLVHVIELPPPYAREQRMVPLVRDLDRYAAEHLERWAAALAPRAAVPIGKLLRIGAAGPEILKLLEEGPPFDLVVLGSHGRVGLPRVLLGSVAEKIVRHAPCPVLVVRPRLGGGEAPAEGVTAGAW